MREAFAGDDTPDMQVRDVSDLVSSEDDPPRRAIVWWMITRYIYNASGVCATVMCLHVGIRVSGYRFVEPEFYFP